MFLSNMYCPFCRSCPHLVSLSHDQRGSDPFFKRTNARRRENIHFRKGARSRSRREKIIVWLSIMHAKVRLQCKKEKIFRRRSHHTSIRQTTEFKMLRISLSFAQTMSTQLALYSPAISLIRLKMTWFLGVST